MERLDISRSAVECHWIAEVELVCWWGLMEGLWLFVGGWRLICAMWRGSNGGGWQRHGVVWLEDSFVLSISCSVLVESWNELCHNTKNSTPCVWTVPKLTLHWLDTNAETSQTRKIVACFTIYFSRWQAAVLGLMLFSSAFGCLNFRFRFWYSAKINSVIGWHPLIVITSEGCIGDVYEP